MATYQLAGLASNFDWKSFVDQVISYESAPVTRLQNEQASNTRQVQALNTISDKFKTLQTAVNALGDSAAFAARSVVSTGTLQGWSATADTATATGSYKINVSQLATSSKLTGGSDVATGISATDDVSGLTLSDMRTAVDVTSGVFSINGQQITVDTSDSLQDIFDRINTATGGAVTASYSAATDQITLSSGSEIVLGAGNDTSNFLTAARLANNGSGTVSSSGSLGTLDRYAPLATAGLSSSITAVDGSGNGSFTVNGVQIDYNINSDSLNSLLQKINTSTAGVSATYDSASDRILLTNKNTGDVGVSVSETAGGVLDAFKIGSGQGTLSRGKNALYSINDGGTLTSTTNTLTADTHGITGLSINATSTGTETYTVAGDTDSMRKKVDAFITAFNDVQSYIDEQTKVTTKDDKVTAGLLSNNREVQSWTRTLRSQAFASISGLSGTISRLEGMGLDFSSSNNQLSVKSETTLTEALSTKADDVAAFFTTKDTGFAATMNTFMEQVLGTDFTDGYIENQTSTLTKSNTNIDLQIDALNRQLDQRRSLLESSFIAMETATQKINTMQSQINNAFFNNSSSSSK